jgi:PAS domain S-box-containing protein
VPLPSLFGFLQRSGSDRAKLETYFALAAQPLLAISRNGKIRLINQRSAEIFGYEPQELLGQNMQILLPERCRTAHASHLERYFSQPRERPMGTGMEVAARRKDGTEFPVEITLRWTEDAGGMLAIAMVVDISERKRTETELARVNAELRRSNSELAQFAYVASHDLQEPLRMVTGYLQLLERRYGPQLGPDAREFIEFAVQGAARMKSLIEDLLRLSRVGTQTIQFRKVSAHALFEAACANLQVALEETDARVSAGPLPMLVADAGLLTQVFQNLVGNALKFHAPGVAPEVHVSAAETSDGWVLSVRDNGIGIEPQHRERIFRIFERLHSASEYSGSGVGLAITQRIVERHGGRIWVESTPGQGSTFSFSVPNCPAKEPSGLMSRSASTTY